MSWLGTFIYGFPHHHLQKSLWKRIGNLGNIDNNLWLIIGDLMSYQILIRNCWRIKATQQIQKFYPKK